MIQFSKMRYWWLAVMFFGLVVPKVAHMALITCKGLPDVPGGCDLDGLLGVPAGIFDWLIGLAAAVLMLVIVIAGARMILYHVAESPEAELQAAKLTLTRGLWGFAIVIFAFAIVHALLYAVLGFDDTSAVARMMAPFFK